MLKQTDLFGEEEKPKTLTRSIKKFKGSKEINFGDGCIGHLGDYGYNIYKGNRLWAQGGGHTPSKTREKFEHAHWFMHASKEELEQEIKKLRNKLGL